VALERMEPALVIEEKRPPPVEVSWAATMEPAATMRTEVNFMVMVCGGEVFKVLWLWLELMVCC
jgi:hypothetical protein